MKMRPNRFIRPSHSSPIDEWDEWTNRFWVRPGRIGTNLGRMDEYTPEGVDRDDER